MTDRIVLPASTPLFATVEARRATAFRTARRHSTHVRVLRRLLMAGVVLFVGGTAVVTIFDPFGAGGLPEVAIGGARIEGTKVTMVNPKMSGFQKDGRPYAIEAARAVQDIKAPNLVDLFDLKARLVMADKGQTRLTAATGHYNNSADTMSLDGGAQVASDNGLNATIQDGLVEFKTSHMITTRPVNVTMPGKRITADGMEIIDGGKQISFTGRVHTAVTPAESDEAAPVKPTPAKPTPAAAVP